MISKSQIRKAGSTIRAHKIGGASESDYVNALSQIQEYRASYAQPLDTTLTRLQALGHDFLPEFEATKRLKREATIVDKLANRETKLDLSRMYDIGGCRAIVSGLRQLKALKQAVLEEWSSQLHGVPIDYVTNPRSSGYRAVHVIVREDDHLIEIQLRTRRMHDWADLSESFSAIAGINFKQDGNHLVQSFLQNYSSVLWAQENGQAPDKELIGMLANQVIEVRRFLETARRGE